MPRLIRINWSGEMLAGPQSTDPYVEQFSSTLHVLDEPETLDLVSYTGVVKTALTTFWESVGARQSQYTYLRMLKVNFINIVTGLQITDPTNSSEFVNVNGNYAGVPQFPTTTAMRISLDDGTRNRRAKGGIFHPRPSQSLLADGRWSAEDSQAVLTGFTTFLAAITFPGDVFPVIYSRTESGAFPIRRIRIGNVPDNIRTRKNDMPEQYITATIDPE